MIAVLADDLSGAAELAGVALRHGLTAEVQTDFHATGADVICLDTDSRLLSAEDATARVAGQARKVVAAGPAWLFKKCDSVLRGPVLAEARAVATATGQTRLLVLPANPSRGRLIRDGHYFIGDRPLQETAFARDPHHPRLTSLVAGLLGADLAKVDLPDGLSAADLRRHARALTPDTLPVGAADFFSALLEERTIRRPVPPMSVGAAGPTLLVCGSAVAWPQRLAEANTHGIAAFALPHDVAAIAHALGSAGRALIGIGDGPAVHGQPPKVFVTRLAATVAAVTRASPPGRLLLEGGATAAAVVHALRWTRLEAVAVEHEIAVLRPVGSSAPLLLIKPGSYAWPGPVWPVG